MRRPLHIALAVAVLAGAWPAQAQDGLETPGGPVFRFSDIDENNDGWVIRSEWSMSSADFKRLDSNFDNMITRSEFEHDRACDDRDSLAQFNARDIDGDGWLTRPESQLTTAEFNRLDRNRDSRINRLEFDYVAPTHRAYIGPRSMAWRTGYQRGILEGLAAGREDYVSNHGWDLESQSELARADSGYTPQVGLFSDYQGGYLEGFENAYRVAYFNARNGR